MALIRGLRYVKRSAAVHALRSRALSSDSDCMEEFFKPKLLSQLQTDARSPPPLSVEAVNVAAQLKRARGDHARVTSILDKQVPRLLRMDLLSLFHIFIRAKEVEFAETIFETMKKQSWYKPHASHYLHLVELYCRAKGGFERKERVLELVQESEEQGLIPNACMYILPMSFLSRQGEFETCMKLYERMHSSTCTKFVQFYQCLKKRYENAGLVEEAEKIQQDYLELVNTQPIRRRIVVADDYISYVNKLRSREGN